MTAVAKASQWISPEEYLEGEKIAEVRHEYLAGELFAMAGASKTHHDIAFNIAAWLRTALRGKPCRTYIEGVKVRINPSRETLFYYPDVFVGCDPRDLHEYFSDYPSVIFEILSPETARYDQREKRFAYQTIETLQTYVLVDQHKVEVTLWQRAGADWEPAVLNGRDDAVPLPSLNLALPVTEIYAGIAFIPAA